MDAVDKSGNYLRRKNVSEFDQGTITGWPDAGGDAEPLDNRKPITSAIVAISLLACWKVSIILVSCSCDPISSFEASSWRYGGVSKYINEILLRSRVLAMLLHYVGLILR